jgi:hypothetical protein
MYAKESVPSEMQVRMKDGREYKYIFSPTSYIKHKRFTE